MNEHGARCINCGLHVTTYGIIGDDKTCIYCMPCIKQRRKELEHRGIEYVNNSESSSDDTYYPFRNLKLGKKENPWN